MGSDFSRWVHAVHCSLPVFLDVLEWRKANEGKRMKLVKKGRNNNVE